MIKDAIGEPRPEPDSYFTNYEATNADLEALRSGIDTVAESKLIEQEVLNEMRFVTFDSKYLYVFTKGVHASNDKYKVEEIVPASKEGFKTFKIGHSGFIGQKREDYKGARAWLLCDEIETTAVGAKKFPSRNIFYQPELPQPKQILDVVSMAPKTPYDDIQKGRYGYLTDVIFHEAGHIENRRLEDSAGVQGLPETFPTVEQK